MYYLLRSVGGTRLREDVYVYGSVCDRGTEGGLRKAGCKCSSCHALGNSILLRCGEGLPSTVTCYLGCSMDRTCLGS